MKEFDRLFENLKLKVFEGHKIHFKDLIVQLALEAMKEVNFAQTVSSRLNFATLNIFALFYLATMHFQYI